MHFLSVSGGGLQIVFQLPDVLLEQKIRIQHGQKEAKKIKRPLKADVK